MRRVFINFGGCPHSDCTGRPTRTKAGTQCVCRGASLGRTGETKERRKSFAEKGREGVQRKVQGKFFARRKKERPRGGDHLGEVVGEAEESLRQDGRAEPGLRRVLFLGGKTGGASAQKISFTNNHFVAFVFLPFSKHGAACI